MNDTTITSQPDFHIKSSGEISAEFLDRNILTFNQAALFVRQLPYRRNIDKSNIVSVLSEKGGTCSTKHALLKQLAEENDFKELRLTIGLFKMNGKNTPGISNILKLHNLEYIPEAHCYLKYNGLILDCTKQNSNPSDFVDDLIEEIGISPNQITDYKIKYHKNYLMNWLENTEHLNLTLSGLWTIREQCIQHFTDN